MNKLLLTCFLALLCLVGRYLAASGKVADSPPEELHHRAALQSVSLHSGDTHRGGEILPAFAFLARVQFSARAFANLSSASLRLAASARSASLRLASSLGSTPEGLISAATSDGVGAGDACGNTAAAPFGRLRMFFSGIPWGGAVSLNTLRPDASTHCH